VDRAELRTAIAGTDMAEIAITSDLTVVEGPTPDGAFTLEEVPGVAVTIELAAGEKCQRCWKVLPEVGGNADAPDLCNRCTGVVRNLEVPAQ